MSSRSNTSNHERINVVDSAPQTTKAGSSGSSLQSSWPLRPKKAPLLVIVFCFVFGFLLPITVRQSMGLVKTSMAGYEPFQPILKNKVPIPADKDDKDSSSAPLPIPLSPQQEERLRALLRCDPHTKSLNNNNNTGDPIQICVNGSLPPFAHTLPRFVPHSTDQEKFMLQFENRIALAPDWVDWSWQVCISFPDAANIISAEAKAAGSWSFQHFHDNTLGYIYQARHALDLLHRLSSEHCNFTEHIHNQKPRSNIVMEEWGLLGFDGTKQRYYPRRRQQKQDPHEMMVSNVKTSSCRDNLPRIHPLHVEWLRKSLPIKHNSINRTKVVWVSRNGGTRKRQLRNEVEVVEYLRKRGAQVLLFNPAGSQYMSSYNLEQLLDLLGDACAFVGVHGGAMYNQYFASPQTNVIELMPTHPKTHLIPGQYSGERIPPFMHRAIWHNANVLRQPYWRIHIPTEGIDAFEMTTETMDKIAQALSLSGCVAEIGR